MWVLLIVNWTAWVRWPMGML